MAAGKPLPDIEQSARGFRLMEEQRAGRHRPVRLPMNREIAPQSLRQQRMSLEARIRIDPEHRATGACPLFNDEIDLRRTLVGNLDLLRDTHNRVTEPETLQISDEPVSMVSLMAGPSK